MRLPPGKQPNTSTHGSIEFASILHRNAKHKILTHASPNYLENPVTIATLAQGTSCAVPDDQTF